MIRVEYVVDTEKEYKKVKEYIECSAITLNISSIEVYCKETQEAHFFSKYRNLEREIYIFKEDELGD